MKECVSDIDIIQLNKFPNNCHTTILNVKKHSIVIQRMQFSTDIQWKEE